ncbi:hypothetical protein C8Q75DRAFT_412623 [Abortiporus biennis]|nr:hypothetical protein C8Q75DRAFT_412623 [Abortiporus biennis]
MSDLFLPKGPRLPIEVCKIILNHIDDNFPLDGSKRQALFQCYMVCRSWVPCSRTNLYKRVVFYTTQPESTAVHRLGIFLESLHSFPYLRGLTVSIVFSL